MAENRYHPDPSKNGFGIPSLLLETPEAWEEYWRVFRTVGPRHRNVARWLCALGWSIQEDAMKAYLAPEVN